MGFASAMQTVAGRLGKHASTRFPLFCLVLVGSLRRHKKSDAHRMSRGSRQQLNSFRKPLSRTTTLCILVSADRRRRRSE